MNETAHSQANRRARSARVLQLRPGQPPAEPGLSVDPALVRIAERQREHSALKAQQEIARQLGRLADAVERLVARRGDRRGVA